MILPHVIHGCYLWDLGLSPMKLLKSQHCSVWEETWVLDLWNDTMLQIGFKRSRDISCLQICSMHKLIWNIVTWFHEQRWLHPRSHALLLSQKINITRFLFLSCRRTYYLISNLVPLVLSEGGPDLAALFFKDLPLSFVSGPGSQSAGKPWIPKQLLKLSLLGWIAGIARIKESLT